MSDTENRGPLVARFIVGLVFLSEGIQKFVVPELTGAGRFAKLGFTNPEFWATWVGCFEIACATALIAGIMTRLAAIPLIVIMVMAFIKTKWDTLLTKGFWVFAHDFRTDFAMTVLLLYLFYGGGGNLTLKAYFSKKGKSV